MSIRIEKGPRTCHDDRLTIRDFCFLGSGGDMAGHAIRGWQLAALLQLLFATSLPGAQTLPTAADAGAQGPGSPSANGSYFGSRLVPPKPEGSCQPNIGPMYQADAIVTGTDMRQRPWGFFPNFTRGSRQVVGRPATQGRPAHRAARCSCRSFCRLLRLCRHDGCRPTARRPGNL